MQNHHWLGQKYRAVFGYTGLICALAGITILFPLVALMAYPVEMNLAWGFLVPGIFLVVVGWLFWCRLKDSSTSLSVQDGTIIVVLSWIMAIASGTIPFITISGLNFTQADRKIYCRYPQ